MKHTRSFIPLGLSALLSCASLQAETINLNCQRFSEEAVDKLLAEQLLESDKASQSVKTLNTLCSQQESTAQAQHEALKDEAIQNWLWTENADKPGNQRLKARKR